MFANIKAKLLKVDLRKGGKKILVFESTVRMSAGELEAFNEMIDQEVALAVDSQVISYRVRMNAKTNEPVVKYKVDETGVVSEVKEEGKQVEMDLGLPPEKQQIKEEAAELPRSVVEEFIIAGLAPQYSDLNYDFIEIVTRRADGDSYLRLASDLNVSTGRLAEILDEYCGRVAPLAAKWNEWREGRLQAEREVAQAVEEVIEQTTKQDQQPAEDGAPDESGQASEAVSQEAGAGDAAAGAADDGSEPSKEAIEDYILQEKPRFDDVEFDPELFQYKKESGRTWMEIAAQYGVNSSKLQSDWGQYKKRVAEKLKQNGAA
ncbi:2-methylcitrate dehydratase [Paenibacillus sp. S-38]|uniref:2-methylcitrate dehydratase n=1 Tax=Paenibacillus sp. S-38 TaxID=3416710 RepID=UPI003CFAD75F